MLLTSVHAAALLLQEECRDGILEVGRRGHGHIGARARKTQRQGGVTPRAAPPAGVRHAEQAGRRRARAAAAQAAAGAHAAVGDHHAGGDADAVRGRRGGPRRAAAAGLGGRGARVRRAGERPGGRAAGHLAGRARQGGHRHLHRLLRRRRHQHNGGALALSLPRLRRVPARTWSASRHYARCRMVQSAMGHPAWRCTRARPGAPRRRR